MRTHVKFIFLATLFIGMASCEDKNTTSELSVGKAEVDGTELSMLPAILTPPDNAGNTDTNKIIYQAYFTSDQLSAPYPWIQISLGINTFLVAGGNENITGFCTNGIAAFAQSPSLLGVRVRYHLNASTIYSSSMGNPNGQLEFSSFTYNGSYHMMSFIAKFDLTVYNEVNVSDTKHVKGNLAGAFMSFQ